MALPHFKNVTTADSKEEPVYSNLFEINFKFPALNKDKKEYEAATLNVMMLNATNISLDLTKPLGVAKQYFKYSGRQFLTTMKDNSIIDDLKINFNLNVSDNNVMTTWNLLKKWYDNAWNSQTGELHYKKNNIGQITANIHDREGVVIRRVQYMNVQLKALSSMEFKWETETILSVDATFIADYFVDMYYDLT